MNSTSNTPKNKKARPPFSGSGPLWSAIAFRPLRPFPRGEPIKVIAKRKAAFANHNTDAHVLPCARFCQAMRRAFAICKGYVLLQILGNTEPQRTQRRAKRAPKEL